MRGARGSLHSSVRAYYSPGADSPTQSLDSPVNGFVGSDAPTNKMSNYASIFLRSIFARRGVIKKYFDLLTTLLLENLQALNQPNLIIDCVETQPGNVRNQVVAVN